MTRLLEPGELSQEGDEAAYSEVGKPGYFSWYWSPLEAGTPIQKGMLVRRKASVPAIKPDPNKPWRAITYKIVTEGDKIMRLVSDNKLKEAIQALIDEALEHYFECSPMVAGDLVVDNYWKGRQDEAVHFHGRLQKLLEEL